MKNQQIHQAATLGSPGLPWAPGFHPLHNTRVRAVASVESITVVTWRHGMEIHGMVTAQLLWHNGAHGNHVYGAHNGYSLCSTAAIL